jgi:phage terminase large subunit GpA-like protein
MTVPATDLSGKRPVLRVRADIAWLPERYRHRETRIRIRFRPSAGERNLYRKKKRGLPSVWAAKYRKVTYGPLKDSYYDPTFVPHMNGIIDTFLFPSVQQLTNCKAPQTGGSAGMETAVGYLADNDPADTLIVYPDRDTGKKRCTDYLQPMFKTSPRLRRLLTGVDDDMASLRIRLKTMLVYMAWAGSVTSIGNVSAKYLFVDELDKCPDQPSKKEAGFEDLVAERTSSFDKFGSKTWWNSTPTEAPSKIAKKLREMDVVFDYHAACPDCGQVQLMEFDRIDFGGCRDPKQMLQENLARYICATCGSLWDDRKRDLAIRAGGWYARDERKRAASVKAGQWRGQPLGLERTAYLRGHHPKKVGFHSPAWISPLNSLAKCASAFLRSLKDRTALLYFVTQIKAEEYIHFEKQRAEDVLLALRDDRPEGLVPSGGVVSALVAGSDTQDNGHYYWIDAVGYGLEQERWRIRAGFVETDAALLKVLFETEYKDVRGRVYPVQLVVKDAMGHRTKEVYNLCLRYPGRIVPYKGATGRRPNPVTKTVIDRYPGTNVPIPGGVVLYTCDSHHFKDQVASKLAIKGDDPGAWHMDGSFSEEQAAHLCAEYRDDRGLWQCPGNKPNHYWDSAVLSIIAADLLQLKFLAKPVEQPAPPPKKAAVNPYTGGRTLFGR